MAFFWKNARLKYSVWCQLVFYMTQKIHNNFFTMTKIGRITTPEALSCLHTFITLKKLRTLLYVALFFWYCCYQHDSSPSVNTPVSTYPRQLHLLLQVHISQNYSKWLAIPLQSPVIAIFNINKIHIVKNALWRWNDCIFFPTHICVTDEWYSR